jgi:hypothetical protein
MMEFIKTKRRLILSYVAENDGSEFIYRKLEVEKKIRIRKCFRLEASDLITSKSDAPDDEFEPVKFTIAKRDGEYFCFEPRILGLNNALFIHHDVDITNKTFLAERDISIFGRIDDIAAEAVYIGGTHPDAIPENEFNRLLKYFPTSREVTRYAQARVGSILAEYLVQNDDYVAKFHNLRNRRPEATANNITSTISEFEGLKFELLYQKLKGMLNDEEHYSETRWQIEIVQILLILNPKYLKVFREPPIRDSDTGTNRSVDYLLVDASGNIDIAEIKQPFDRAIVSSSMYRGNHIPMRELSGSIMQVEKYLLHLNRWGKAGEQKLTKKYQAHLPDGLSLKITNPSGIIISGRSNNLTEQQLRDFEVIRRKYKNLVDIVTYDDLLSRLECTIKHWKSYA